MNLARLHGVTSGKTVIVVFVALMTSNPIMSRDARKLHFSKPEVVRYPVSAGPVFLSPSKPFILLPFLRVLCSVFLHLSFLRQLLCSNHSLRFLLQRYHFTSQSLCKTFLVSLPFFPDTYQNTVFSILSLFKKNRERLM
jgi:hypothetical protein